VLSLSDAISPKQFKFLQGKGLEQEPSMGGGWLLSPLVEWHCILVYIPLCYKLKKNRIIIEQINQGFSYLYRQFECYHSIGTKKSVQYNSILYLTLLT